MPTRLDYDYRRAVEGQDQQLAITGPPGGGTFYILVYGADVPSPAGYQLTAEAGPFVVTTVTPDRGSNRPPDVIPEGFSRTSPAQGRVLPATVTVSGAGFDQTTTVQFIGSGGVVRVPTAVHLVSPTTLTLDLDLTTWPAGAYDLRLTKGAFSRTRVRAFTVVQDALPNLETDIVVPSGVGPRFPTRQTVWVEYRNTGNAAMPAPLLKVTADNGALITLDADLATAVQRLSTPLVGLSSTVQMLATGSGATPGILQPGDSGHIPVYYLGMPSDTGAGQITFSLNTLTADEVSWALFGAGSLGDTFELHDWSIPWFRYDAQHDPLRPETIPPDAWDAIRTNLATQIGPEWGDYVVRLDSDANYLASVGQNVTDITSL
jgi:hypothetical protein